jgi:hypothetical protein
MTEQNPRKVRLASAQNQVAGRMISNDGWTVPRSE